MKIICAGVGKTGTKSLAKALRMLGYNVCDVVEQLFTYQDEWYGLFYEGKEPDFKAMFVNVDAITDLPGNIVFEEILEAFPNSKVILTIRDEEAWVKSLAHQLKLLYNTVFRKLLCLSYTARTVRPVFDASIIALFGSNYPNATWLFRKRYRMHNDRVKAVVPKEQLLIYSVKEGWAPLCTFLDHDVPTEPYPHENTKGEVAKEFEESKLGRTILFEGILVLTVLVAAVAVGLYLLFSWSQ